MEFAERNGVYINEHRTTCVNNRMLFLPQVHIQVNQRPVKSEKGGSNSYRCLGEYGECSVGYCRGIL